VVAVVAFHLSHYRQTCNNAGIFHGLLGGGVSNGSACVPLPPRLPQALVQQQALLWFML
jgi:hypothetical protein